MGLFYTFTVSARKWVNPLYRVRCAKISFGSAIKAAVRQEYMGNLSSEVLWEQDTTYCTPCLCLLCGRGSRPWMLEPRRQIHPTPSTTISDIPHQSSHIRWPCLLFCVSLSHTVWHGSCSIWYLQLRSAMSCAPEYLSESKDHCRSCTVQSTPKSTGLGLRSHSSYCISCLEIISFPVNVCNNIVLQLSPLFSRIIFLCIIPAPRWQKSEFLNTMNMGILKNMPGRREKKQYYQQGIKIMAMECHTILSVRTEHAFFSWLFIYR